MEKNYTFEEFKNIIEALRGDNGCPWDKEQTHESLKPCIVEESAELLGAIRIYNNTGNAENMREELGDILLQVVMHSEIAKEEGLFTLEDVISEISQKMIRRHPHVFGTVQADSAGVVLENWEEIKKTEKEGKSWIESPLREIPRELPALARAPKVLKKIDKLYRKAEPVDVILDRMEEQIKRLKFSLCQVEREDKKRDVEEQIGELLEEVSEVSRQFKISTEQILTDRIDDWIEKYEPMGKT